MHYSGPGEWSLRRMVLHRAFLAVAAGGVSAFCHRLGAARAGAGEAMARRAIHSSRRFVALAEDVKVCDRA